MTFCFRKVDVDWAVAGRGMFILDGGPNVARLIGIRDSFSIRGFFLGCLFAPPSVARLFGLGFDLGFASSVSSSSFSLAFVEGGSNWKELLVLLTTCYP